MNWITYCVFRAKVYEFWSSIYKSVRILILYLQKCTHSDPLFTKVYEYWSSIYKSVRILILYLPYVWRKNKEIWTYGLLSTLGQRARLIQSRHYTLSLGHDTTPSQNILAVLSNSERVCLNFLKIVDFGGLRLWRS